jgi:hypothetical protein
MGEGIMNRFFPIAAVVLLGFSIRAQYLITTSDSLQNNGADYVIITHADFTEKLYPLCEIRDSLGLAVKMVEADLIYSTFQGAEQEDKIKAFTQRMYDGWNPRPGYILLVGDASFSNASNDYIPSKLFPKFSYSYLGGYTTHASDNWYVQLDGEDYLPDCAIGRFPVSSAADCEALVRKTVAYERYTVTGNWQKTICLIASQDYEQYATPLLDSFFIPANDSVLKVFDRLGSSSTELRQKTVDAFNRGIVFIFMVAHGSSTPIWTGNYTLFSSQDIDKLTNSEVFPVVFGRG